MKRMTTLVLLFTSAITTLMADKILPSATAPEDGKPEHVYTMMNGNNVYSNALTALRVAHATRWRAPHSWHPPRQATTAYASRWTGIASMLADRLVPTAPVQAPTVSWPMEDL